MHFFKLKDIVGDHSLFVNHLLSRLGGREMFFHIFDRVLDKQDGDGVGYYPKKDFVYIATQLPTIEHEIAHMVEIQDEARVLLPDWGFKMYRLYGKKRETNSAIVAGIARETRVRAIQRIIMRENSSSSMADHPAWSTAMDDYFPYGRFRNHADLVAWIKDIHERTCMNWSLDKIESEWNKKIDYLLNWMET